MPALDKFYIELCSQIKTLEDQIFKSPPKNELEYHHRRGSWVALTGMRDWIHERAKKDDDDEDS